MMGGHLLGLARGIGSGLFAFGGAYWHLATALSQPGLPLTRPTWGPEDPPSRCVGPLFLFLHRWRVVAPTHLKDSHSKNLQRGGQNSLAVLTSSWGGGAEFLRGVMAFMQLTKPPRVAKLALPRACPGHFGSVSEPEGIRACCQSCY